MPTASLIVEETAASTVLVTPTVPSHRSISTAVSHHSVRRPTLQRRSRLLRNLWRTVSAASLLLCLVQGFLWLVHAHLAYLLSIGFNGVIMPLFWCWYAFKVRKQNAAAAGKGSAVTAMQATGKP